MIPATLPRAVRAGVAAAGVASALALSSCAAGEEPRGTDEADGAGSPGDHADGTYTAEGSYATPETVETISVTVTLADDVITAVEVTGAPQRPESADYQGRFIGGIADVVVGEDIDDLDVSRVAGSSLTSGGFNDAIEAIKAQAAA